ncbi:hypothetical protein [Streptomyces sp. NPDC059861]|uniref:hypothetical protein n=1 Tax=Streptomyces sp. NPDC059861 TaxID=3346974 RepID=UPI003659B762
MVAVGAVLGALVAVLELTGRWAALGLLSVHTATELPWQALGATAGACAVLAVVSSVTATAHALRTAATP